MPALALISGKLSGDPRKHPCKNGNFVVFFNIRVANGATLEYWNVATFDAEAQAQVEALFDGAPIAATGEMTIELYEKDGKQRINRKLLADAVLTIKSKRKDKREAGA